MKEFEVTITRTYVTTEIIEASDEECAIEEGKNLRYDAPSYSDMIESSTKAYEV